MPRAAIIDCDPGTDDAIAIWLALASPELDVRLVSVVGGNVGLQRTVANACAIVALSGRAVPVVAGAGRALLGGFEDAAYVHGDDGLGGVVLPPGAAPQAGHAVDAMRALLRAAEPDSVTLVGIGPATNLGLLLATEPALADRVAEIVLMTGAWSEGNVTPSAEFNAWNDPEALAIVMACGRPITLATLDVTNQALCRPEHIASLRGAVLRAASQGACARATADIWASVRPSRRSGGQGHEQHDACAVMWLVAPHLFTHRPAHVSVECAGIGRGRTVVDRWQRQGAAPNARLLETVDADGFFAVLIERLTGLP